jgi:hypothetical protein
MKMSQSTLQKIRLAASRESQREQGYFDGRFVARTEQPKTVYSRKKKHTKRFEE